MTTYLPSFVMNDTFPRFQGTLWNLLYGSDPFISEQSPTTYPKYNIIKDKEDKNIFHIVMAVAGMDKEAIKLSTLKNKISISYEKEEKEETEDSEFVAHHLSNRDWKQTFTVPEGYEVKVLEAKIEDGLLYIDIKSIIPDDLKEKEIKIKF